MSPYYRKLREKIGSDLLLMPGAAAVIHNSEGHLLLQEKSEGVWSLPAGAIEPGEAPADAIRREVLEETGLIVEPEEILGVFGGPEFRYVYANGDAVEYTIVLYRCAVSEDTGQIEDSETKSLAFFSEEGAPSLALPYPKSVLFGGSG
jgi:ADP-ribose pyrophosphatase YjhB (NUDIX family)